MGKGGTLDRAVGRDDELERFGGRYLLQAYMAPALPNYDPPRPAERPNYHMVIQAGDLGHTAISMTSALGANSMSSSTGSI